MIADNTIKENRQSLEADPHDLIQAIVLLDLNLTTLQRFPRSPVTLAMQESLLTMLAQLENALAEINQATK